MSPVLLDTFCIADFVGLTVWPSVNAPSVLLAIAPLTLKHPSIRVVNCTIPITIVLFKVSMVNLAIRFIQIHSNSLLFSVFELAYVNSSVFKLVNAISIHRVQNKIALVNFASWVHTSAVTTYLTIFKLSFVNWSIWPLFYAVTIWFTFFIYLAPVHCSTWSDFPI